MAHVSGTPARRHKEYSTTIIEDQDHHILVDPFHVIVLVWDASDETWSFFYYQFVGGGVNIDGLADLV